MIILSAIGRFFKKIWDWIKETAWIQPLLIVGVIFGVIFSIPSIVKAAKSNKKEKNTSITFYNDFKYSLEGEGESKADKFTYALADIMLNTSATAEEDFKNTYGDLGDKFFVTFVEKDCAKCKEAKGGFETLKKRMNKSGEKLFVTDDRTESFKMVTIFTDDENKDTKEDQLAFSKYLERHQDFFEEVASCVYENPYVVSKNLEDQEGFVAIETADVEKFYAPTTFLVELGAKATSHGYAPGVTEVMIGVDGSSKSDKAKTLLDCWNHKGDFSSSSTSK